jgi:hypothetical protein
MPITSGSQVVAVKLTAKCRFRIVTMLLFYNIK